MERIHWLMIILVVLVLCLLYFYWWSPQPANQLDTFSPETKSKKKATIVNYYTNWCGYSQAFLPVWKTFEARCQEKMPELMVTEEVCEGENEGKCTSKGVSGFPTVVLYLGDQAITYNGKRTEQDLMNFVQEHMGNY
jgi:hypothetical protein